MAFPWLSGTGFEDGTLGTFDAEVDTGSHLDFPHYTTLARIPGLAMPYRGAYCMRVDLATSTSAAYVQETGSWDEAATETVYYRFSVWISPTIVMATTNIFSLFQLWSSTNTVESTFGVYYTTAEGYRFFINETESATNATFYPITLGKWHTVEIKAHLDAGGGNDGTLDAWVDGSALTGITGLDQGAITSGILGVVGQDAGTTAGVILFDDIIADDAQIYPDVERFPNSRIMTFSGHVFVGPGNIESAALLSTGTTDTMTLYDTDRAYTSSELNKVVELNAAAFSAMSDHGSIHFERGCYAVLSSSARGQVVIAKKLGPVCYGNEAVMRNYALNRTERQGGA